MKLDDLGGKSVVVTGENSGMGRERRLVAGERCASYVSGSLLTVDGAFLAA